MFGTKVRSATSFHVFLNCFFLIVYYMFDKANFQEIHFFNYGTLIFDRIVSNQNKKAPFIYTQ